LHREAERRLGREEGEPLRIAAPEFLDLQAFTALVRQFAARRPAAAVQIEFGVGPSSSAPPAGQEFDVAIVSREIGEGDDVLLSRRRRVWAGGRSLRLNPETPVPLAVYSPACRWRRLALEQLDRAGRSATIVLQSASTPGLLAALEAGLAIAVLPEDGLPNSLKPLGDAEGLPALPDFELALRRGRKRTPEADAFAEMILHFFAPSASPEAEGAGPHDELTRDPTRGPDRPDRAQLDDRYGL
jgi:DNA-binding transcriptional LysR family regulator